MLLVPAALAMAAWTITLVRLVLRSRQMRVTTGQAGLVGQQAVAETELSPEGWVKVQGERWRAVAPGGAQPGDRLRVVGIDGLVLRVAKEA
jgi:membrane-bound serine protease (ClpP class)